jgi:glyoxylase-like metal-dependent hydrolase (beta-lactamase superfamily II)
LKELLVKKFGIINAGILVIFLNIMACTHYETRIWDRKMMNESLPCKGLSENYPAGTVRVFPLKSGNLQIRLSGALNLADTHCGNLTDKDLIVPVYSYLIHNERFGWLMIDTGCTKEYSGRLYGPMTGFLVPEVMAPTVLKPGEDIETLLSGFGLIPEDIGMIFFTHLHLDHTSGLSAFNQEIVLVAGKGESSVVIPYMVEPRHFKKGQKLYFIDFNSDEAIDKDGFKTIDLLGDGSLWALSTPGHSKGHVSYLAFTENGPILIAGDAVILNDSLTLGAGPGSYSRDMNQAQATLEGLLLLKQKNPGMRIWAGHDEILP